MSASLRLNTGCERGALFPSISEMSTLCRSQSPLLGRCIEVKNGSVMILEFLGLIVSPEHPLIVQISAVPNPDICVTSFFRWQYLPGAPSDSSQHRAVQLNSAGLDGTHSANRDTALYLCPALSVQYACKRHARRNVRRVPRVYPPRDRERAGLLDAPLSCIWMQSQLGRVGIF